MRVSLHATRACLGSHREPWYGRAAVAAALPTLRSFAHDRTLRRAAFALALYRLAEFGPWVGILVYAYDQGGATATGLVSFGILVPTALFAPIAGPLIDRFGATRVLVVSYGSQAIAMGATAVALLTGAPASIVYVLAAVTAMVLTFTHPAHAVASPALSRTTEQLVTLNAVTGWVLSLGLVVAPALAGVILAVSQPGSVYAAGAVALVGSAVLVLPLRDLSPPLPPHGERSGAHGSFVELRDGARALSRSGPSREVVLVLAATFAMVGAFDVLVVTLALGGLDIGGSGAGYLAATHGLGALVGAVVSLSFVGRARLVPVLLGAGLVAGAAFVVLGLRTSLVVAFATAAVTGASRSVLEVSGQTLLQRVTPTALLARVFAFKEGLAMGAWGAGSALVPLVIAVAGVSGAVVAAGCVVPVVVLLRLRRLLAVDASVTVPAVTIALLRALPVFRALPVPALEGVAREAHERIVPAGVAVVQQGDYGDRFYAIADGLVEVAVDGRPITRLSRGEGFGEIALLRDRVRMATVTTCVDTRLVEIEREPFLVAVTGHGDTRARFESLARDRLEEVELTVPAAETASERTGHDGSS